VVLNKNDNIKMDIVIFSFKKYLTYFKNVEKWVKNFYNCKVIKNENICSGGEL